ncbi:hypothetical protein WKR88_16040 [Trinickia caryophylli]|uniref:hypothetical protein n=1 Tax=Trinickia caryophylli TaxID=28094 RepID=UPI00111C4D03|nr:hypothetical protein [Trinickia caryophylli]TRX14406.1 hypothetical protein FNF07_24345 [Trinickia caryophylli]WQE14242.1 hypothetical protein U0034_26535 [Trinickia caryophylli]
MRRRRTGGDGELAPSTTNESASTGRDEDRAADGETREQATGVTRLARGARNVAYRAFQGYVGMLAISAGYRTVRNPGEALRHPLATLGGIVSFSERLSEQTIQQGRADVLARHGSYIPADSACHEVEPRISYELPLGVGGRVTRGNRPHYNKPTDFELSRFVPNGGGLHAVHHESLHCYTHPNFATSMRNSPYWRTIEEALTEHFADELPGHAIGKATPYDLSRLPNGKRWSTAAAELEKAAGTETLQRAYFSGDVDAIRAVSAAIVDIWPKEPTHTAWRAISLSQSHQRRSLAECFVGAALLSTGKLPADPAPGSGDAGNWAWRHLPVNQFKQIAPKQAKAIRQQAQALQSKLGRTFDQAFYGFDSHTQGEAMGAIQAQIHREWKPVL